MQEITLGNILTMIIIIGGFLTQYHLFSNRMSKFEGYTKAKLEDFEKDMNTLWSFYKDLKKEVSHEKG